MRVIVLILMLAAFPVQAATICVENNISKCAELGYTQKSCKYGGVSCPYDPTKYYCAEWRCEDGRYSSRKTKDSCVAVKYKDLDCFACDD